MYGNIEIDASRHLLKVIAAVPDLDFCLIGGWAVHLMVNERYRMLTGRAYLGSRDIDLGLPTPEGVKRLGELLVKDLGFSTQSFRYVKQLNFETGEELSYEEAKALPLPMIFPLYVDVMLPFPDEGVKEMLGFIPPEEPLLDLVFRDEDRSSMVRIGDRNVRVPTPDILMAMKFNSVVNRHEDHKRLKDLCDLTALALYSGQDRSDLVGSVLSTCDGERLKRLSSTLSTEDVRDAASIMEIEPVVIRGVISEFGWSP